MNKKTIILIGSAAAVLLVVAAILIAIFAGGKNKSEKVIPSATVTVGDTFGEAGKTVRVPVTIKGNSGVMGVSFEFDYDAEKLEYLSTDSSGILTTLMGDVAENGKLKLIFLEDNDVKEDGTMFTLVFMIKEGIDGKTDIEINKNSELVNYDERNVPIKSVNGEITIK